MKFKYQLLRIRDDRMPWFDGTQPLPIPPGPVTYRIRKTGGGKPDDPYRAVEIVATYDTLQEAKAMLKLMEASNG